uniref:Uncharacterized protein n=1 Tax=Rhipicephalus zambeziensis TaxID=60191 RepID=A0A224Y6B2_9ACAR
MSSSCRNTAFSVDRRTRVSVWRAPESSSISAARRITSAISQILSARWWQSWLPSPRRCSAWHTEPSRATLLRCPRCAACEHARSGSRSSQPSRRNRSPGHRPPPNAAVLSEEFC